MPGQPIYRAFKDQVERCGGEGAILERIAAGETLRAVARSFGVSRPTMYRWIKKTEERHRNYVTAREQAAHAIVEEGMEIIDTADTSSSAAVTAAKERAGYRKWLAGVTNRKEYGSQTGPAVNVSIGELHLAALQRGGKAPVEDGMAEVIEEAEVIAELPAGEDTTAVVTEGAPDIDDLI